MNTKPASVPNAGCFSALLFAVEMVYQGSPNSPAFNGKNGTPLKEAKSPGLRPGRDTP